jgi:outer membrane lipoprotein-sorting protein
MPTRFATLLFGLLLVAPAGSGGWAVETPEAVIERLAAVVSTGKALELDFVLVQYRNERRVEARGVARYHADGKRFTNEVKTQAGDKEVDVRMVCDGTVVWVEVRQGEKIMAVQKFGAETLRKLGGASFQDPKSQWEDLRGRYSFSETREGKLGDTPVTILEGALKPEFVERQLKAAAELGGRLAAELAKPQLQAMVRARLYVEPETGRMRKTEVLDKDGKILISFELERVKTDVVLAEALFAYTPPKDLEVVDLDRLLQADR